MTVLERDSDYIRKNLSQKRDSRRKCGKVWKRGDSGEVESSSVVIHLFNECFKGSQINKVAQSSANSLYKCKRNGKSHTRCPNVYLYQIFLLRGQPRSKRKSINSSSQVRMTISSTRLKAPAK